MKKIITLKLNWISKIASTLICLTLFCFSASGQCGSAFSYSASSYCTHDPDPSPIIAAGSVAGTFISTTGLVLNSATGVIDLSLSTPGYYTVINSVPAGGSCSASTSAASFDILPSKNASFSYSSGTYCPSGSDPTPVITGASGGVFSSSPAGLVFINAGTGKIDLSASALNTYTVTYTTSGICPESSNVSVTITTTPQSSFSYSGTPYCADASDPLPVFNSGSSAGVFISSPGLVFLNGTTGQIDVSASTPGVYTVTNKIFPTTGCPSSTSSSGITILQIKNPAFKYSSGTYCQSASNPVPLIIGTAGGSFTSSPGGLVFVNAATGEIDLAGSAPGNYMVTYNTPGPCPDNLSASVTITTSQVSAFTYAGSPYCTDDQDPSPTYSGGGSGGIFTSSTGLVFIDATTGELDLSSSTPGTYSVTNNIAAAGSCAASSTTSSVTINPVQNPSFSYSSWIYCPASANPVPTITGTPGGIFASFPSGLVFVNTTTGEIDLAASALGDYYVTYTTPGPCSRSFVVTVRIAASLITTFWYPGDPYCSDAIDPLPEYAPGGVSGIFTSSAGLIFIDSGSGEVDLSASTPGTYNVTNTFNSTGGCPTTSSTSSITINQAEDSTFSYSNNSYCQTGTTTPVISGTPNGTFSSSPAGLVLNTATGEIDLASSALGTYSVTYNTPGATCPRMLTVSVSIISPPTATFSYTGTPYCKNEPNPSPVLAAGSIAGIFSSTTGLVFTDPTTGQVDLSASTAGTYTVTNTIAASGGCPATSDQSTITINPVPNVTANSAVICNAGETATLNANGANSYLWSTGATTSSITVSPSSTTSYTVTGTTNSCSDSVVVTVTVGSVTSVSISGNLLINLCEETILTASPSDGTYNWGPSASLSGTSGSSVTATPKETTTYYVTYTNSDGCTDSDTTTVVVTNLNTYFLPTGLTANGDGINDEIKLHGRGIDYFTLRIFDRIGEKVFETSDMEKGWNGRLHGLPMNDGVFVYTLNITFCDGTEVKQHGDITLVK
jgi:gliding motility-associated-like protein